MSGIRFQNASRVVVLLTVFAGTPSQAAFEAMRIPTEQLPPGTPGLGGGLRLPRDVYVGGDRQPDVVPLYLYKGKWLFANATTLGLHAVDTEQFFLNVGFRYRFNKLVPADYGEVADGLQPRRQTLEGGFSTGLRTNAGIFKVEWAHDLLNRHDGYQVDLTYRYPFKWSNFMVSPFFTYSFLNSSLANYYWGVSEDESVATGIPAYQPGATSNLSVGVNTFWQATDHLFLFANLGFETLNTDIQNSPLVEKAIDSTAYVGAGYLFGSVSDSKYVNRERADEWSWRVNYGYTGEYNVVPEPMKGNFEGSTKIDTQILGLTVGKLLQAGQRVDIYGKLALFRHLEEPDQDNFWNYTAYVIAIGKGYFPWSDTAAFRWGFGMGASYAEKVPVVEQIKQTERGRNTSKFLNYLEWMVDFPIDSVIKSKLVRNCFVGVTVVHRSGIFSTSDILGDVSGGSDWYTAHVECLR